MEEMYPSPNRKEQLGCVRCSESFYSEIPSGSFSKSLFVQVQLFVDKRNFVARRMLKMWKIFEEENYDQFVL